MMVTGQEDCCILGYNDLKIKLILEEHVTSIFRLGKEAIPETITKKICCMFFPNIS
jgi:hypothetical protein